MQTAILASMGIITLLAGFTFRLVLPGQRYYAWAILAVGVALLAVIVVLDFRRMRGAITSRRGKIGFGTIVKISLLSGIIILTNAISVGTYHRFDFTGLAQFTLTSQTKEVLAELSEPVEVVSFFTPSIPPMIRGYAQDLLAEYQKYTDQLTVREIDPELNPDRAREYGVTRYGAMYGQLFGVTVFRSDEGQRDVFGIEIASAAEHAFTSAILEVTGTRQKKVYFLTGHGESSIFAEYDRVRSGLRDNLFQVAEVDLLRSQEVPSDAAVLVIAGPQEDLGINELEILKTYLENGGSLLVLLNPNPPPRFRELLFEWGIVVEDGIIVDPQSYVAPNQDTLLVPRTHNYWGLGEVYFPGAASILPRENFPDNLELIPLVVSSSQSWVETGFTTSARPRFDEAVAERGSRVAGVGISRTKSESADDWVDAQLVVVGDSDFAANQHFLNGNNSDFFLRAVSWLTAGEEIISVDRKVLPVRRLILDPEQVRFLHVSSIGLLPVLLLLAASFVWWRRR